MGWELRDDALFVDDDGFLLRVGLPWMRSLPLACVLDLVVEIDGLPMPMDDVRVCLAGERLPLAQLVDAEGWWFLQDRLLLAGPRTRSLTVPPGQDHDVEVSMRLLLPYLESPSGGPAVLPFRCARRLGVNAVSARGAFRDVR